MTNNCLSIVNQCFLDVDVPPMPKNRVFWIQAAIAQTAGLTSPSPREDAPSLYMFRAAL